MIFFWLITGQLRDWWKLKYERNDALEAIKGRTESQGDQMKTSKFSLHSKGKGQTDEKKIVYMGKWKI